MSRESSLFKQSFFAAIWNGSENLSIQILNLAFGIFFARLLSPEDFGLVALATVMAGFLDLFIDSGFGSALIQAKDPSENQKSSLFWLNIMIGVFLGFIFFLSAGFFANFYEDTRLIAITQIISLNFILSSTVPVQLALLRKELNMKLIFKGRIAALLLSGGISLALAYYGFGYWSLVARVILTSFFFAAMLWLLSGWFPKLHYQFKDVKSFLNFSLPLLGSNLVGYLSRNLDSLIIGKIIGKVSLGLYNRGFQLVVIPGTQINGMLAQTLFSSFSKRQDNNELLYRSFKIVFKIVLLVSVFSGVYIFINAPLLIDVLLGDKWTAVTPILRVLTLYAAILPAVKLVGILFNSKGATQKLLKISLVVFPIYLLAVFIGANFGAVGVAYGIFISMIISGIPQLNASLKLIDKNLLTLMKSGWPSYILYILVYGVLFWFVGDIDTFSNGMKLVGLPLIIYGSLTFFWYWINKEEAQWLMQLIRKNLGRNKSNS